MRDKIKNQKAKQLSIKILKIVGLGLLIASASILAPTLPYALIRVYLRKKFNANYSQPQIGNAMRYLKRKKFIAYKNSLPILTKLGRNFLQTRLKNMPTIKKVPWDQKWRVLTFDIPEVKITARHTFRRTLKELGFFHFQRSVFICPYPCLKEINQITKQLDIAEHVHILTAERFANDKSLIKSFQL